MKILKKLAITVLTTFMFSVPAFAIGSAGSTIGSEIGSTAQLWCLTGTTISPCDPSWSVTVPVSVGVPLTLTGDNDPALLVETSGGTDVFEVDTVNSVTFIPDDILLGFGNTSAAPDVYLEWDTSGTDTFLLTGTAQTSGAPSTLKVLAPAHTGITASTSLYEVYVDGSTNKQWAAGNHGSLAYSTFLVQGGGTLSADGASDFPLSATATFAETPQIGANVNNASVGTVLISGGTTNNTGSTNTAIILMPDVASGVSNPSAIRGIQVIADGIDVGDQAGSTIPELQLFLAADSTITATAATTISKANAIEAYAPKAGANVTFSDPSVAGEGWAIEANGGSSFFGLVETELDAAEYFKIDASSTAHTDTQGSLHVNTLADATNVIGLAVNTTLNDDYNNVKGVTSVINSPTAGGKTGNITSSFFAYAVGDGDDTNHSFVGFNAQGINKNGGTATATAFKVDATYDIAFASAGGDVSYLFDADEYILIDAATTDTTLINGIIDLNVDTATASASAINSSITLTADVNNVAGNVSIVNGLSTGGGSGNTTSAYVAGLIGDNNDTSHNYVGFNAGNFTSMGGAGTSIAFDAGSGHSVGMRLKSGSILFQGNTNASILNLRSTAGAGYDTTIAGGDGLTSGAGGDLFLEGGDGASAVDGAVIVNGYRFLEAKGADVASANDVTLGSDGNYFDITGTTQINRIASAGWNAGSKFLLQFDGVVTVKDAQASGGGYASILISGSGDYVSAAGSILECVYDGTNFKCWPVYAE